jgi:hypothetical protein
MILPLATSVASASIATSASWATSASFSSTLLLLHFLRDIGVGGGCHKVGMTFFGEMAR